MAYGIIEGITDNSDIEYCPFCGEEIGIKYGDGTAKCDSCGRRFGVVEDDEEE